MKIETEIDDYDLICQLSRIVLERVKNQIDEEITAAIRKKIESTVDSLVEERLAPILDDVIQEGFPQTDAYGDRRGSNVTLAQFMRKKLTTNTHSRSWLQERVESAATEIWKKELAPEVKAAKAALRKQVDERLSAELARAAREAAGIR